MEIWKEINGYENYLVSSEGRVFSKYKKGVIAQEETKYGYLNVTLYKNGNGKTRKVHRFVAEAFIDNPDNKPQVNHIDGNKKNNNVSNLEWVTAAENMKHACKTGLYTSESARKGYKTRLKKYGQKYLSEKMSKAAKKADAKKGYKTRLGKYGKSKIDEIAYRASMKAKESVQRKTFIFDIVLGKNIAEFNSRKEAAQYLNVDPRRISEYIKQDKLIRQRYKCKG